MAMAFPEAVSTNDNARSALGLPPPPLFASRPMNRLKSQLASRDEKQIVTHEEVHYTPRNCTSRNLGNVCGSGY